MLQYLSSETYTILNKDGEIRKVNDFRKRVKYASNEKFVSKLLPEEVLRIDKVSERLRGHPFDIGFIIDANDVDFFSINENETINYVSSDRAYA
jgi:hypothetical protein